jgi:hypothetical protein
MDAIQVVNLFSSLSVNRLLYFSSMKKIDILNFITDFRKEPNSIKTYREILNKIGPTNEMLLKSMLQELEQGRVIRETQREGEKAYQVISR